MSAARDPLDGGVGPEGGAIRPTLHQPPNSQDLERFPPASAGCARVREQMRDFADGDLARDDQLAVEEHVHVCRSCALALGRVEHETLQVRQAFRSLALFDPAAAPEAKAPAGMRETILRRLIEESAEGFRMDPAVYRGAGVPALPAGGARDGGGSRMLAGSAASDADAAAGEDLRLSPGVMLVLAGCALTALIALQFLLVRTDDGLPERLARLVITSAIDAHGMLGEHRLELSVGSGLGDDQLVWVGKQGVAQADLHDASEQTQPAATLVMTGDAALRLSNGQPMLVNGSLEIETRRPVELAVADGSRIHLGVGQYRLTAVDPLRPDQAFDPLRGIAGDLALDVQVVRGQDAYLQPVNGAKRTFSEGSGGLGSTARQPFPNGSGGSTQSGSNPPPTTPGPLEADLGALRGVVWERDGNHPAGADVLLGYLGGGISRTGSARVTANGVFEFLTGGASGVPHCESPFVVVQMMPPDVRADLGITVPNAYRVARSGSDSRLVESLVIDASVELRGRVVAADGVPQFGASLVPCVVDDLFGTVLPWSDGMKVSVEDGSFRMTRLPVALPRHQHLVVVAQHPSFATAVAPIPVRGSISASFQSLEIELVALREVTIRGITPNANVQILQDVPGLPPGCGARIFPAQTDSNGDIPSLRVGNGPLWLRTSSITRPSVRELVLDDEGNGEVYRPALGATRPLDTVYEPMHVLTPAVAIALPSNYRYRNLDASAASEMQPMLRIVDGLAGNPVPNAQVFAVQTTGPRGRGVVRFLGFTSQSGLLGYTPNAADTALVAIDVDGDVGIVAADDAFGNGGAGNAGFAIAASGAVVLDASLRPAAAESDQCVGLRFDSLSALPAGLQPSFHRFASPGNNWRVATIPPGRYQVTVGGVSRLLDVVSGGQHLLR